MFITLSAAGADQLSSGLDVPTSPTVHASSDAICVNHLDQLRLVRPRLRANA
jgi:hypothetical protein